MEQLFSQDLNPNLDMAELEVGCCAARLCDESGASSSWSAAASCSWSSDSLRPARTGRAAVSSAVGGQECWSHCFATSMDLTPRP